jgi:UDP:flavonoid glycosyltransferase YjiC (YdhE family)
VEGKMKTIFIANGNGLSDNPSESITRTINLAKKLEQKGHKVHFLTTIGGFIACKRAELDVDYYLLPASLWSKRERGFLLVF